ncbi:ABC transporter substrate-binding protein [Brachybacterium saurashtrense]|uniref:ABC transporter substrate-binding protein n=1 Tax=Brachybacterium saurashtrense TaxID=556288 RepID=A0A345YKG5_9MICO|nr:ABC transporter substrate-binding protein [Brachybacterium saurashtrense]AXK44417.1 ABC transporter substrate-binding protein [Brachybacterium saurashtrense]RRR23028.1 ABC transporter substrate-binding protein [Brachybacterium saurashtrense]
MIDSTTGPIGRRGFLRGSALIASAAGIVAGIGACAPRDSGSGGGGSEGGGTAAGEADPDGHLTAAISYELGTNGYDPMTTTSALTVAVNWHTLEGLTELHPVTREVYAALATETPSAEGDSVDVTLREGAVFHDGSPVTAEDVVFSFERVLDPANTSLYAQFIPFIEAVEAKDDTTVTFSLKHPTGVFAERLSTVKIVPRAAVEADPDAFDANPVGTGPWQMTDNSAASKIVEFERFDDYTGPMPAAARTMSWQVIPDPSTRTNALQSKTVQAIDSVPYLSIDQLQGTGEVESVGGFGLLFAMFNNGEDNPFNDVRNRQAFLYAIDMDKVIETGLSGQAEAASCFVQTEHPNYKEASTVYSLDLEKAKELFAETGLTSFRLLCTDHDWVAQCTPIIQESLTAAGVDVQFEQKQSSDVYTTIDGGDDAFDVVIAPGDPSVFGNDPDLLMRWWYGGDIWTDTRMHWKGQDSYEKVQELLAQGLEAADPAEQESTWGELFDLLSDEVPLYPLFHRKAPTAWDPTTLVDFAPISLTGLSFVGVGTTQAS